MHSFLRRLLPAILSFIFLQGVSALTLSEALEQAEKHPVLQQHALNIAGRRYEIIDATAKGPGSLAINSENFGDEAGFDNLETTVEYSLPLQNSARVSAKKKLAEENVRLSELEKTTARWLIMSQTSRAFHRALVLRDLVVKASESIENSEKLLAASKIMVESGSVAEQEVFQAELVLQQAKLEAEHIRGIREDASAELAQAMGLDSLVVSEVTGSATADLEIPELAKLEEIIFRSHPDIVARQLEISQTAARLELLKAENHPSWNLTAGARHSRETGRGDFLVGISADLPRSGDNRGARKALQEDIRRLTLERSNSERELRLRLQSDWQRCHRLQEQVKKLRDAILPAAWQLFELSLTGYQLGKTDQIVVLQARKDFLAEKENYLQRLEELYEAVNSIESLAGYAGSFDFSSAAADPAKNL
ncbi:MAG TPA: TolC family protein [Candidatus Rifleibacterium sp.]|nr:TolC family protein [Candidatus Rifleibacterium sp.]